MKRLLLVASFIAAALCGCGGGEGEGGALEIKPRPRIQYHIGMFQGYDPPWVDHSRWMKPSAIENEEEAGKGEGIADRQEAYPD